MKDCPTLIRTSFFTKKPSCPTACVTDDDILLLLDAWSFSWTEVLCHIDVVPKFS